MSRAKTEAIKKELSKFADKKHAQVSQGFFKTGKGEYGEGDVFIGVKVPVLRKLARRFRDDLELAEVKEFLHSKIHEERMLALLVLVYKFQKVDEKERAKIYTLYLKNTKYINNWDLVDVTAPHIVGTWLFEQNFSERKMVLLKLAKSDYLWERRIAIVATHYFIKRGRFKETLILAELLLQDGHDLIQKAVGWMLREVGKREQSVLENFLKKHYKKMPRTMLRYAIERLSEERRLQYLKGLI